MLSEKVNQKIPEILSAYTGAMGIDINGKNPWDIQIHNHRLIRDLRDRGSLALGEGYVEGYWSCQQLDELFTRLLSQDITIEKFHGFGLKATLKKRMRGVRERMVNWQSSKKSTQVGRDHYDINTKVYETMLDSRMIYSCAYWENAEDLETAQLQKLKMICEKLELKKGERLLDMGCGWGGLAIYAAENYGVEVVGITISNQQMEYAASKSKELPVKIIFADYRSKLIELEGEFDKIASIGMMEHVGRKNDSTYFRLANEKLKGEGLMLVQTIGTVKTRDEVEPWIDKYIFPNGRIPSAAQLCKGLEEYFKIEDWQNLGKDYDRTLMAWWKNFDDGWKDIEEGIDPKFYRMWSYYLLSCAGLFRSGNGQLWQMVLSHPNRKSMYRSKRQTAWP